MKGHKDLRLACAFAVACAVLALLIPLDGIALIFAIPLALLLPGYALAAAAFARRNPPRPYMLLLSLALSLATLTLGGLVLNYLGGIHPLSWGLLLLLVVLVGCSVAAARRGPPRATLPRAWPLPRGVQLAMLIAAAVATTAAIVLASATVPNDDALGYTQLWILPQAGSLGREAQVGVRSQEQRPANFDLRIRIGDYRVVKHSFRLEPGEARVIRLRAPPAASGVVPVVATLLRHNRPFSVYRRVKGSLVAPLEQR